MLVLAVLVFPDGLTDCAGLIREARQPVRKQGRKDMTGKIDSHVHICGEDLYPKWRKVIAEAKKKGIEKIMAVCPGPEEARQAVAIAGAEPMVDVAVGFHPNHVLRVSKEMWEEFEELVHLPQIKAVGEIGMDYYSYETVVPQVLQKELFVAQLELAGRCKKPVLVHMRQAAEDTRRYLKGHLKTPGVMHNFHDSCRVMDDFLDMGMYISFSGQILEGPESLREAVRKVPADRLLVETNSPARILDSRCSGLGEGEYLSLIVDEICVLRKMDREELLGAVSDNYKRLFSVDSRN